MATAEKRKLELVGWFIHFPWEKVQPICICIQIQCITRLSVVIWSYMICQRLQNRSQNTEDYWAQIIFFKLYEFKLKWWSLNLMPLFFGPHEHSSVYVLSRCSHVQTTLCDPMDYSPPGSSVHWILQARILEWQAISFSKSIRAIEATSFYSLLNKILLI